MSKNTDQIKKIGKNISMFCGKIFSIFRWDMKKIFTNPIAAIIAVGLMALPSISRPAGIPTEIPEISP